MTANGELTGAEKLVAAIIREGIRQDGPDYLGMPCGRWWCESAGLDPPAIYAMAVRDGPHAHIPYMETERCFHRRSKTPNFMCRHRISPVDSVDWLFKRKDTVLA